VLSDAARAEVKNGGKQAVEAELTHYLSEINAELEDNEKLEFLSVVSEQWLPENGLLTPSLKIKRGKIEEAYAARVAGWYAEKRKVLWPEPLTAAASTAGANAA
jgi:long-chain acyl-CoA synthetase